MAKRCPPGVLCIENITLLFVIVVFCGVMWFLKRSTPIERNCSHDNINISCNRPSNSFHDPHSPPLRAVPINIPTQSVNVNYRQVGILTNGDHILPLMGRPLFTNRDKWNFYTMTDKSNMIKLPIVYKGKTCTGEYGCENIFSNDHVHVEGYNDTFKVTMYETDVLRYIPQL